MLSINMIHKSYYIHALIVLYYIMYHNLHDTKSKLLVLKKYISFESFINSDIQSPLLVTELSCELLLLLTHHF